MTSVADKLASKSQKKTARRQVRLRLVYIDFWSVVKLTFLLSICLGVVTVVAAFVVWTVLGQIGVLDSVNALLQEITANDDPESGLTVGDFVDTQGVLLFSLVISLVNIVVLTALSAVSTFLYNLAVRVTGGLVFGFTNS